MKLAGELKDLDVFSISEKNVIAKIKKVIVDPENGSILGFQVYGEGISKRGRNVVSFFDVKEADDEAVYVDSFEKIEGKEELPRAYQTLDQKISILGSKVFSQKGDFLGRTGDFAIDMDVGKMSRLYVERTGWKKFFLPYDLIFSFEEIIEIQKNKIIVTTENRVPEVETAY